MPDLDPRRWTRRERLLLLGKLGILLGVETISLPVVLLLFKLAPERVLSVQNRFRQSGLLWMYPGIGAEQRDGRARTPSTTTSSRNRNE